MPKPNDAPTEPTPAENPRPPDNGYSVDELILTAFEIIGEQTVVNRIQAKRAHESQRLFEAMAAGQVTPVPDVPTP